jgi:hypothetical protein
MPTVPSPPMFWLKAFHAGRWEGGESACMDGGHWVEVGVRQLLAVSNDFVVGLAECEFFAIYLMILGDQPSFPWFLSIL